MLAQLRIRRLGVQVPPDAPAIIDHLHCFSFPDLRHLFATLCIESGVDIPTVSRWLGHKDGGALAMKVYGHLRNQHSASMAKLVNFAPAESNIIPLTEPKANLPKHGGKTHSA